MNAIGVDVALTGTSVSVPGQDLGEINARFQEIMTSILVC